MIPSIGRLNSKVFDLVTLEDFNLKCCSNCKPILNQLKLDIMQLNLKKIKC